jgi:LuxR family maltose regulon positive regulatory protein
MSRPPAHTDLLLTKLCPPPVREKRVARTRLLEKLDASLNQKLTLVCAPAGYGKTTLLSQWIKRRNIPAGWITLDNYDNDLAQFQRYFLAAIQNIDPAVGALIPEMLQPSQPLPGAAAWTALVNDLAASQKEFVLILDDYHEVEAQAVHDALEYIIEHMPGNLHLVLASRADPPLSLARLRARGYLIELRQSDLRFTTEDSGDFLNAVMGLDLSPEDVIALETHTEGWIAALQMAALSLQERGRDPSTRSVFIRSFTGSHRFVLDYLVEEVLGRQPPALQEFLLRTAILKRLCGPLCNAITDRMDGQDVLEGLEAANLFIIPLDDERHWYRYHHLFSDLLNKHLLKTLPQLVPDLHRRASSWHQKQGLMDEAIDHALLASDYEMAATLIKESVEATLMRSQIMNILNWMERLPDDFALSHPMLCFYHAWALLMSGRPLKVIEQRLQDAQDAQEGIEMTGVMVARISVLRAYILTFQAEIQQAAALCRRALEHLPDSDLFLHSITAWILSLARLQNIDLENGILALDEVARLGQEMGNLLITAGVLCDQAKLHKRQGHLQRAKEILERALRLATDPQGQRLPIASKALIELGEIKREWNHLEEAQDDLLESIELSRQWSQMAAFYAYFPLARIRMAQGDGESAREAIENACQIARRSEATEIDDLIADLQQAIFFVRQGDLAAATRWAQKWELAPGTSPEPHSDLEDGQDQISAHLRKYQHIALARLFIRQGRAAEALALLKALLTLSRELGRIDLTIEIQILRALALQIQGDPTQAMDALAQALSLAEPGGYLRIFLDEGEPMTRLIQQAASRGIAPAYTAKLLAASSVSGSKGKGSQPSPSLVQPLIEPLSERELKVLRLLATGMSNPEIANELCVAVSTVRSHCKNIYGKLGVHRRWDAVQLAQALGLLKTGQS